ncbi:hypothetical protein VTI28DRAFT_811 [Corynascus sepedonium]
MLLTSEEEADDDGVRMADIDDNRPFARHDSSDSSNLNRDHDHNEGNDGLNEDDEQNYFSASASESGSEDDGVDGDGDDDDGPPQQPFSQHAFAPPFYGRPPTPLPPSPSLTSLLRPSRPTTPDASDDDGHGGAGNTTAGGSQAGGAGEPLPRARPRVPTYEYYGFVLYLLSSLFFLIYLLWSYLPSPFLHALGIYYYPNRWWSLAIPSFIVMLLVYIYVALAAYNTEILTLPLGSVETVVDEAAMVAVIDSKGRIVRGDRTRRREGGGGNRKGRRGTVTREGAAAAAAAAAAGAGGAKLNWREVWNEGTDAVMDVPLAGVCEVLYGEGRDYDSDLEHEDVGITRI